jgi:DinB superfamily
MRRRPEPSEYFEYYRTYIDGVPEGDIVSILRAQSGETDALLMDISPQQAGFRYAPGKWTLQEVIRHVIDIEWVFTARALHFARAVEGALPGVEQDDIMVVANAGAHPLPVQLAELRNLRQAGAHFFDGLDNAGWGRSGVASGRKFTVRAIAYIIAGHERHHINVIREKYLG